MPAGGSLTCNVAELYIFDNSFTGFREKKSGETDLLDHINAGENKTHEIEKNCNTEKNHKDKGYFMIVVDPLI